MTPPVLGVSTNIGQNFALTVQYEGLAVITCVFLLNNIEFV